MRRFLAVVVLLSAGSLSASDAWVDIKSPKIHLISQEALSIECQTAPSIRACTEMRATLTTACNAGKRFYEMSATVKLQPDVFSVTTALLPHEMGHIADVAALLRSHVKKLASQQFETETECEASARVARDTFAIRLADAQQITDLRRDGKEPVRRTAQGGGTTRAARAD